MAFFNKRNIIAGLILVCISLITIIRENVFLEINAILYDSNYNNAYFYWFEDAFRSMSKSNLITLKWLLTVSIIVLVSGLTLFSIHFWFKTYEYTKAIVKVYVIIFASLLLLFAVFWFANWYRDYFFVLRKAIGLLSSPLPLFILFTLLFYLEKNKNNT